MKKIIIILLSLLFLFGQESMEDSPKPCEDSLLKLAQNKGIKDILRFRKLMKACEKVGGEKVVDQIVHQDWQRDYRKAKTMASFTSTFSICVFLVMVYYFVGLGLATK